MKNTLTGLGERATTMVLKGSRSAVIALAILGATGATTHASGDYDAAQGLLANPGPNCHKNRIGNLYCSYTDGTPGGEVVKQVDLSRIHVWILDANDNQLGEDDLWSTGVEMRCATLLPPLGDGTQEVCKEFDAGGTPINE